MPEGDAPDVSGELLPVLAGVLYVADGAQPATVPARDRPAIPAKTLLRTDGLIQGLVSLAGVLTLFSTSVSA